MIWEIRKWKYGSEPPFYYAGILLHQLHGTVVFCLDLCLLSVYFVSIVLLISTTWVLAWGDQAALSVLVPGFLLFGVLIAGFWLM